MKGGQRIGAGRPAGTNSKTQLIQARVTVEEEASVKETAKHYGLSVSDLIRRALGLAVLALLVACSIEIPTNPEVDPPAGADVATEIALAEWSAVFELPDGRAFADPPTIRWFEGDCLEYTGAEVICEDGATVYTPFDTEIHLAYRPLPSDSALAHELLHWILLEWQDDPDGDHKRDEWMYLDEVRDAITAVSL